MCKLCDRDENVIIKYFLKSNQISKYTLRQTLYYYLDQI